jgi:transcriptional regulator with XRE-family HTH domain
MFYDNYIRLCNHVKKAPSAVAEELGLSRASVYGWKNGKSPTDATLQKIADYFGVAVGHLSGNGRKEKLVLHSENEHDDSNGFFHIIQKAREKGYSVEDLTLALDFLDRARQRDRDNEK